MDLPPPLDVIHQPQRLRIMGLLYRQRDVGFAAARDALGMTDGNLAAHAAKLAQANLLEARKVLTRHGFEARYRITKAGSAAFRDYLERLRTFVAQADGPLG